MPVLPRIFASILALAFASGADRAIAQPAPVRSRLALLVDTSSRMVLSPEWRTFSESCSGWNPCTFNGNPTPAQEICNPCVRDTVNFDPSCATSWDASCRTGYAACFVAVAGAAGCSPTMNVAMGVPTRGDGSAELPGCDLDGDGLARESALHAAKQALRDVLVARTIVELSLWRFRQVAGGQTCATDAQCPDTPGGLSVLTCENHDGNTATSNVCALDADSLDGPTTVGFEGQCAVDTFTGSPSTFACTACDFVSSYDRARCEMFDLNQVRTGGISPIDGTSVACFPQANPTHRFQRYHGAVLNGAACDPTGGEKLTDFPTVGTNSNTPSTYAWLNHSQPVFSTDNELRAHGLRPLAAALRDLRTDTLAGATADVHTPCRGYRVIVIVSGTESCENLASATAAAASFQNLSFTNGAGTFVPDYDVPVHVIAYAPCPAGDPLCAARQELDAIAAAGATGQAIAAQTPEDLSQALRQIVRAAAPVETCNGLDDDCDGLIDEGLSCLPIAPPAAR